MYNKVPVTIGILFFLGILTFPFWKNAGAKELPKPVLSANAGTTCVEEASFMRMKHMVMLDDWRDEKVRDNNPIYTNTNGKQFKKSLTKTCMNCHDNKKEFCDACHAKADVELYCFDCHLHDEYPSKENIHE